MSEKLVKVRALKGSIEHGSAYAKKGGTCSVPESIAKSLVKENKAVLVTSTKKPAATAASS
jgi:hypothetical protein